MSQIESKLTLGANPKLASKDTIRQSIKTAIVPTIDSVKTYGIVSIPGMMTGLIIGGVAPLDAVKFQLMVVFIHTTATIMSALLATYLSYKHFCTLSYFKQESGLSLYHLSRYKLITLIKELLITQICR